MAVRFNNAAQKLRRSSNLPSLAAGYTFMAWVYVETHRNQRTTIWEVDGTSWTPYRLVGFDNATGSVLALDIDGTQVTGTSLASGQWYHVAYTRNSSTAHKLYLNGTLDISVTANEGNTLNFIVIGQDDSASQDFAGWIAAFKVFTAELTAEQIKREIYSYRPVNGFVHAWYPMIGPSLTDAVKDYSENGYDWGISSTPTIAPNPPIRRVLPTFPSIALNPLISAGGSSYVPPNVLSNLRPNNLGGF